MHGELNLPCAAGLEVRVAFGGVWKESLTELSGGQRSLLALSLILAMLLFKPAPIYILDEARLTLLRSSKYCQCLPQRSFTLVRSCCTSSVGATAWQASLSSLLTQELQVVRFFPRCDPLLRLREYGGWFGVLGFKTPFPSNPPLFLKLLAGAGGRGAGPEPHAEHRAHDQEPLPVLAVHRGVAQGGHVQQRQRAVPHQVRRRRVRRHAHRHRARVRAPPPASEPDVCLC